MIDNEVEIKAIILEDDLFIDDLKYLEKLNALIKTANEKNLAVYIRIANANSKYIFKLPSTDSELNFTILNQNQNIPTNKANCVFVTIPGGVLYTTSTCRNKHIVIESSEDFDGFFETIEKQEWTNANVYKEYTNKRVFATIDRPSVPSSDNRPKNPEKDDKENDEDISQLNSDLTTIQDNVEELLLPNDASDNAQKSSRCPSAKNLTSFGFNAVIGTSIGSSLDLYTWSLIEALVVAQLELSFGSLLALRLGVVGLEAIIGGLATYGISKAMEPGTPEQKNKFCCTPKGWMSWGFSTFAGGLATLGFVDRFTWDALWNSVFKPLFKEEVAHEPTFRGIMVVLETITLGLALHGADVAASKCSGEKSEEDKDYSSHLIIT